MARLLSRSALALSLLEDSGPSIACCIGRILRGHVAIITKPSPPFPVRDVVLLPGLLPVFLHGCKIKSGSGLGMRLGIKYGQNKHP